jgi:hypothetical protein
VCGSASAVTCAWLDPRLRASTPTRTNTRTRPTAPHRRSGLRLRPDNSIRASRCRAERDHLMLGSGLGSNGRPKRLVIKSSLPVHRTASGSDAWPAHRVSATEGRLAASDRRSAVTTRHRTGSRLRAPDTRARPSKRVRRPHGRALVRRRRASSPGPPCRSPRRCRYG